MFGVTIGEKHSQKDWGLIMTDRVIGPPRPKTQVVDVPMRDGAIDLSESLTGDIKYEDRTIKMTFSVVDPIRKWSAVVSEIENYLHGKKMKIVFDDDLAFGYTGRVFVDEWSSKKTIGKLVISCTAEPYKYDNGSSAEPWEWDSFDLENGLINEMYDLKISGEKELILIGRKMKTCPVVITENAITIVFKGIEYSVPPGKHTVFDIILEEGINKIVIKGNSMVTIDYVGGSL